MRRSFLCALAGATLIGVVSAEALVAEEVGFERPYLVNVENVSGKVGETTALVARLTISNGYKILDAYRNRVIELSSFDDGVDFAQKVVIGKIQNGDLVFVVGLTPTKPGVHPINGVFRVGYHNNDRMDMVSLPLIATVTGTE
jgi:hypothetical protein